TDNLIKAQPTNWLNLELKGRIFREIGKYDEAIKLYEDVVGKIEKDDRLTDEEKKDFANDMRYSLSGLYIDAKKVDKAIETLRTLVKSEPDNPTYNNDLGYIMADNEKDLDEAKKLIETALKKDKEQWEKANPKSKPETYRENPAFVDSLGWVLFKKKDYKGAKEALQRALAQPEGQ